MSRNKKKSFWSIKASPFILHLTPSVNPNRKCGNKLDSLFLLFCFVFSSLFFLPAILTSFDKKDRQSKSCGMVWCGLVLILLLSFFLSLSLSLSLPRHIHRRNSNLPRHALLRPRRGSSISINKRKKRGGAVYPMCFVCELHSKPLHALPHRTAESDRTVRSRKRSSRSLRTNSRGEQKGQRKKTE